MTKIIEHSSSLCFYYNLNRSTLACVGVKPPRSYFSDKLKTFCSPYPRYYYTPRNFPLTSDRQSKALRSYHATCAQFKATHLGHDTDPTDPQRRQSRRPFHCRQLALSGRHTAVPPGRLLRRAAEAGLTLNRPSTSQCGAALDASTPHSSTCLHGRGRCWYRPVSVPAPTARRAATHLLRHNWQLSPG